MSSLRVRRCPASQVRELFARGMRVRTHTLLLVVLPHRESEKPLSVALAAIVPRRVCSTAVGRNRLRRLLRESIRHVARTLPELLPYRAIAVCWNAKPADCKRLRLRDVLPEVEAALQRAYSTGNRAASVP